MPEAFISSKIDLLETEIIKALFSVWCVYFTIANLIFCAFLAFIVNIISKSITDPIVLLDKRIRINIAAV